MKHKLLLGYFSKKIVVTILSNDKAFKTVLADYPHKCDLRHFSDITVYSVKIRRKHFEQLIGDMNTKELTLVGYVNTRNLYEVKSLS